MALVPAGSDGDGVRDGFRFRGGHSALDLTATLIGRLKEAPRDLLAEPADVARWLNAAGLSCAKGSADEHALTAARRLREAIYSLAMARIDGARPPIAARKVLNAAARVPAAPPEIDARGVFHVRGAAASLLPLVAREAIALLGNEAGTRIRQCEADGCAVLFLDTSRSGDRRWCSMTACGNRHKVAEFRRRKRARS